MKRRFLLFLRVTLTAILSIFLASMTTTPAVAADSAVTVSVPGFNSSWTNTGVPVIAGNIVSITASGFICIVDSCGSNNIMTAGMPPEGVSSCVANSGFLVPNVPCWSLVGRIGNNPAFEVGSGTSFMATSTGYLYLAADDDFYLDNSGAWTVTITVTNPSLTIVSPATKSGPPGTLIQWTGSGFLPGTGAELIVQTAGGQTLDLGSYTTDSTGDVSGYYVIPCNATAGGVWTVELKAGYATTQDTFTVTTQQQGTACTGAGAGILPYAFQGPNSLTSSQLSVDIGYLAKALQGLADSTNLNQGQVQELAFLGADLSVCLEDVTPNNAHCWLYVVGALHFISPTSVS